MKTHNTRTKQSESATEPAETPWKENETNCKIIMPQLLSDTPLRVSELVSEDGLYTVEATDHSVIVDFGLLRATTS